VQDEDTARENGPKIQAVTDRLHTLAKQMESSDPAKKGLAFAAVAQRFSQVQQQLAPELTRLAGNPTLAKHLGDAMKLPKVQ
jgi:hypothetical protein